MFGIQEAEHFNWDWRVWALLIAAAVLLTLFVQKQRTLGDTALVPLRLFNDRNFTLANVTIATVGFAVSTYIIPWMIYVQNVQGFTPTQAALLVLPSGVISGVLAPIIGRLTNTHDPKPFAITGLSLAALSMAISALITTPEVDSRWMYAIAALYGVANSMMWGPLSMVATRNLERTLAGAGSSVYNTTRQIGAVIGSAAIAAMMTSQLTRTLGGSAGETSTTGAAATHMSGTLPPPLHQPFADAMSTSIWLPCAVIALGVLVACCFKRTESWSAQ